MKTASPAGIPPPIPPNSKPINTMGFPRDPSTYTYGCIVCNYCPQTDEPHRTQLPMGGDCIDYTWNNSMQTADLTTMKPIFNSTISTPGALFYDIDLANSF